jgi:hypothetical protein
VVIRRFEMVKFNNFEDACGESPFDKSVSNSFPCEVDGKLKTVEIIKPRHGDGHLVYKGTGVRIRKATSREIEGVMYWKRY